MKALILSSLLALCLYNYTSAAETWLPVQGEVCFEASGSKPGKFKVPDSGFLQGVRLTYKSGGVNCYKRRKDMVSKFGCYSHHHQLNAKVGIVITGSNKAIMFPLEMKKSRHETFVFSGGNTANSTTVTFYDDHQPLYLDSKSELQVWYGEALRNRHAHDNSGKTCADVSVLFAKI